VNQLFSTWYTTASPAQFGSQFSYVQPFNVAGNPQSIVSLTVTLANSVGTSSPATANLQ